MARVELDQGKVEILPPGNRWEFSERNKSLKPSTYKNECRDFNQASETIQRLVTGVKEAYVQKDWSFASIIGSDHGFAIIFTNPSRPITSQNCPPSTDFLKPEAQIEAQKEVPYSLSFQGNWKTLSTKPINELLAGTNLYAYNASGAYNEFELDVQKGLFIRKPKTLIYYQSGVAYIHANLYAIEEAVKDIDYRIYMTIEEFKEKIQPLKEDRKRIQSFKTSSPKKLF